MVMGKCSKFGSHLKIVKFDFLKPIYPALKGVRDGASIGKRAVEFHWLESINSRRVPSNCLTQFK